MKRRETQGDTRFITFSCQRRLPLLESPEIAGVLQEAICAGRRRFGFELFAWVIMPEHVHLLVRPRDGELERALLFIKLSVSNRVLAKWREMEAPVLEHVLTSNGKPRFWQKGGGFDRNVRDRGEFTREVRYIHRNPVERGLVERAEAWKWSSVRWWMGQRAGEVECDPPPGGARAWEGWQGYV